MAADHRSIYPSLPGLSWWAAVLVAATTTAIGFAFDAGTGNKELTNVFAALYVLGCVAAVLAVRQSAVFTAVIQPPLILFFTVPGAYWLFHGATFTGVKGILINCGYPLIERFPLMLFTSAGVLLIGMGRWYFGMATQATTPEAGTETTTGFARSALIIEKLVARLTAAFNRGDPAHTIETAPVRRRGGGDRRRRTTDPSRSSDSARRAVPTRSRHVRPPVDDAPDPRAERPRRRSAASARGEELPPRRRPRPEQDFGRHSQAAREGHRDPNLRTGRPSSRGSGMDSYRPAEPTEPSPRRRQAPKAANGGTNGFSSTHHPISRVRYRKADLGDESGAEPRSRPRERHNSAESWQYDI